MIYYEEVVKFSKIIFKKLFLNLKNVNNLNDLSQLKSKYLGKNSILVKMLKRIINLNLNDRIKYGSILHNVKKKIIVIIKDKKKNILIHNASVKSNQKFFDTSLPGRKLSHGCLHPITNIIIDIEKFFCRLGFFILYGQELEDSFHNFDALNVPNNHVSRKSNDTFWFDSDRLLRTQTSSMQIRALEKYKVPIRVIVPGKVYRNDYDRTHTPMFHQVEGLMIGKEISFSNLKWILNKFLSYIFQKNIKVRFRNSFFPFTVPSAEVDIKTSSGQWLEILGCGMVHPNILKRFNIDLNNYSACAFGIGVERLLMIKYGISDIRYFFENNISFLKQFV